MRTAGLQALEAHIPFADRMAAISPHRGDLSVVVDRQDDSAPRVAGTAERARLAQRLRPKSNPKLGSEHTGRSVNPGDHKEKRARRDRDGDVFRIQGGKHKKAQVERVSLDIIVVEPKTEHG